MGMQPELAPVHVLVVARDPQFHRRVEHALAAEAPVRFTTQELPDLPAALGRLGEGGVDVTLVRLQPGDGMRAIEEIHRAAAEIPIVAVLATGDDRAVRTALASGATDFVTEDHLDGEVLRRSLRYAVDRRRLEGEAHRRSVVDETTGAYNARGFEQLGDHHLRLAARSGEPVVLVFVRLESDDPAGEEPLMAEAAQVLREALREADVIGRLGTNTFGILLAGNAAGAEDVILTRVVEAVAMHNARTGRTAALSLSLGAALHDPEQPGPLADLIRRADAVMQRHEATPQA